MSGVNLCVCKILCCVIIELTLCNYQKKKKKWKNSDNILITLVWIINRNKLAEVWALIPMEAKTASPT